MNKRRQSNGIYHTVDGRGRFCNGVSVLVLFVTADMTSRCFATDVIETLPTWEVTTVAKHDMQGLIGGGDAK
jgi:hypothetical protein